MNLWKEVIVSSAGLFASAGTLVCCALPALLVSLGFGATVAGMVGAMPGLVWLSDNKGLVFTLSGTMLAVAACAQWRQQFAPCPADPAKAKACARLRKFSFWVTVVSAIIWSVGFFFAFVAAKLVF